MTHSITRLCLRDMACVEVCPVECMVLGQPEEDILPNYEFFSEGPGYDALDM
jgi:ferredoxin